MRNFKLQIDILDIFVEIKRLDLRDFTTPFLLLFIEADDPDDACDIAIKRIINSILKADKSIKSRILCRKVRRTMRVDKIESL